MRGRRYRYMKSVASGVGRKPCSDQLDGRQANRASSTVFRQLRCLHATGLSGRAPKPPCRSGRREMYITIKFHLSLSFAYRSCYGGAAWSMWATVLSNKRFVFLSSLVSRPCAAMLLKPPQYHEETRHQHHREAGR